MTIVAQQLELEYNDEICQTHQHDQIKRKSVNCEGVEYDIRYCSTREGQAKVYVPKALGSTYSSQCLNAGHSNPGAKKKQEGDEANQSDATRDLDVTSNGTPEPKMDKKPSINQNGTSEPDKIDKKPSINQNGTSELKEMDKKPSTNQNELPKKPSKNY